MNEFACLFDILLPQLFFFMIGQFVSMDEYKGQNKLKTERERERKQLEYHQLSFL